MRTRRLVGAGIENPHEVYIEEQGREMDALRAEVENLRRDCAEKQELLDHAVTKLVELRDQLRDAQRAISAATGFRLSSRFSARLLGAGWALCGEVYGRADARGLLAVLRDETPPFETIPRPLVAAITRAVSAALDERRQRVRRWQRR